MTNYNTLLIELCDLVDGLSELLCIDTGSTKQLRDKELFCDQFPSVSELKQEFIEACKEEEEPITSIEPIQLNIFTEAA